MNCYAQTLLSALFAATLLHSPWVSAGDQPSGNYSEPEIVPLSTLAKGEMETPCMQDEVMEALDGFEFYLRQQPGVRAVKGPAGFARGVNQAYSEGNIKWRVIPDNTAQLAQAIGFSTRIRQKLFDRDCEALLVSIFTSDHQATTPGAIDRDD